MERSAVVQPGTYKVKVLWGTFGITTFELDDWHLSVSTYAHP